MNDMTTVLDTTTVPGVRLLHRLAVLLAAVSGTFCLIFLAVLGVYYHGLHYPDSATAVAEMAAIPSNNPAYRKPAEDSFNTLPTDHPDLLGLKHALAQNKQNEEIKSQIRQRDHKLRNDFFQRRAVILHTSFYLFISTILFFGAVQTVGVLKRQIPNPNENQKNEKKGTWHFVVVTPWLMLFVGLYLGLLLVPASDVEQMFLAKLASLTANGGRTEPVASAGDDLSAIKITEEILKQHWVSFRNFDGNGVGFSDKPHVKWNS
jgi:hypothetical protein